MALTPPASGPPSLWGLSFDAAAMSGLTVEFLKVARHFHHRGYRVHLDLGYDVKPDKGRFFRPYRDEHEQFPGWVLLDRLLHPADLPGYDEGFATRVLAEYVRDGDPALTPRIDEFTVRLSELLVAHWWRLDVRYVLVENGTLPENVVFTAALYRAIAHYGAQRRLGRFVLWRDHDLMWQSEPSAGKYGPSPYPRAVPPRNSAHIRYVVQHERARSRMREWVPGLDGPAVLPNTFDHDPGPPGTSLRARHGIPSDAPLIARCTRIIPQKRIDRDIHLLAALRERVDAWLFVAGDPREDPAEHRALGELAAALGVADRVIFGGRLAPPGIAPRTGAPAGASVRDLLAEADVAAFLTSQDYESFGNPIGEAVAARVPYLTSRFDGYDSHYGSLGLLAPVLETAEHDLPTPSFVDEVAELLTDRAARGRVAAHNHRIGLRTLGTDRAPALLAELLPPPMGERARLSVVVPVLDEAANLPGTLAALAAQRHRDGTPLDPSTWELVLVDNGSTDGTRQLILDFAAAHPELAVFLVDEPERGPSCARRAGMDFAAARARERDGRTTTGEKFLLVGADADCRVDPTWLAELIEGMAEGGSAGDAAIGVCDYYYRAEHFAGRPRLWHAIERTLRCRAVTFALFGGFPDGKGFAVDAEVYTAVGGIEIFYQLREGRFVNHLSDDWDFGIRVRAGGYEIGYLPASRVEINPRRVDHALDEVIAGRAYGSGGTIVMRDIRTPGPAPRQDQDLTAEQAQQAWEFSIKDFTPKNTILPVLLTPALLDRPSVAGFFGPALTGRLRARIAEMLAEMRVTDLTPIHAYKTPSFRLYFEFAGEIFARLRLFAGEDIGHPPPLPDCLAEVPRERFAEFVRYYCEDRESGAAHDYFGNGGVF